ncbi:formylglycine-generating enzyme family protein [Glycomyces xiaoerkulensis]|uniref:formylglycine-generating enzyme family protein n=1 Tax=Glycomyces xiaoerkulensis TaxID=2038139 RepID=UPI0018E41C2E|nr:formylglycine-generating enzyme family protein [Glycomyces xiaoerkulensis]
MSLEADSPSPPRPDGLVELPAGSVTVSDRRTRRSWRVDLAPFAIAPTPVTEADWAEAAGGTGRGASDLPVVEVSWFDAVRYCNARSEREGLDPAYRIDGDRVDRRAASAGYRLPTEAEWEYACRAGTDRPRYGPLDEIGWYRGNSGERIRPVGLKRPNRWGLSDMIGLVWEWCWDHYDQQVYGDYRVLRGGGWFDEHWSCRASVRRRTMPTLRIDDLGLRPVRSLGPGQAAE